MGIKKNEDKFTIAITELWICQAEEAKNYCGVATDKLEFNISMAINLLKEEAQ